MPGIKLGNYNIWRVLRSKLNLEYGSTEANLPKMIGTEVVPVINVETALQQSKIYLISYTSVVGLYTAQTVPANKRWRLLRVEAVVATGTLFEYVSVQIGGNSSILKRLPTPAVTIDWDAGQTDVLLVPGNTIRLYTQAAGYAVSGSVLVSEEDYLG